MIRCFDPILGDLPYTLVLGSSPSIKSLEKKEYYGNSRNAFWKIMSDLYGGDVQQLYSQKKQMAIENHIAIWDVVSTCNRKGSLDSAIKDVETNDIPNLLMSYPSIKTVLFNGATAAKFYRMYIKFYPYRVNFFTMPSTSPAYTIPYKEKLIKWESKLL